MIAMLFHTKFYQLISTRSFSLNGSFWFVVWKCGDAQLVLITMELLPITKKGGYCKNIISVFGGSEEAKVIGGETQQQRDVTKGKAITGVLSIIFNHRCRGFRSPSLKTMAYQEVDSQKRRHGSRGQMKKKSSPLMDCRVRPGSMLDS